MSQRNLRKIGEELSKENTIASKGFCSQEERINESTSGGQDMIKGAYF